MGVSAAIWASVAVSAAGTYMQMKQARKAEKEAARRAAQAAAERRREDKLKKKRADIVASRDRRRASAEAKRFRGQAVNLAANRGAGGAIGAPGSTLQGISGNIQSQLSFNNAFIGRVNTLNSQIMDSRTQQANILGRPISSGSGMGQALSALGSLGLSIAGNKELSSKIFGS